MKARFGAVMLAAVAAAPPAWADDDAADADSQPAAAADAPEKQDLTGQALGSNANKKENSFEKSRFFVDKVDTPSTEKATLIQGSIASSTFGYFERGGQLQPTNLQPGPVPSASPLNRIFTELRLQTDFRHIGGGGWDSRVDLRGRLVGDPAPVTLFFTPQTNSSVQSGLLGENEFEIKELWVVRNGVRSDVFFGRQFVPDLGGVKIDGLRIDYASSTKFTILGFGGLYPIRGSRSIDSDYKPLLSQPAADGSRTNAGRFTGAAGLGAAYRTADMYGAFGGVALVPFSTEDPRIYGTSNGYWRFGPKLDFYHLAIVDVVGSNAVNAGLTNLSLGLNYKPDQRLRGTLSFNRVDTETLNVQAQAFLNQPDPGANLIQNESFLARIATNQARASLSAGLGQLQRFELTAAVAYRYRGEVVLSAPTQTMGTPNTNTLAAAQSVEVYGAITDRRSIGDLRLGLDASRVFGVGSATFNRTDSTTVRASMARELGNGRGEWELEVAYSSTDDDNAGVSCSVADIATCAGSSQATLLSGGGNLFWRISQDWFAVASAFVNRTEVTQVGLMGSVVDPAVVGVNGYLRIAYRF